MTSPPPQPDPAETNATAQVLTAALNGVSVRLDKVKADSEAAKKASEDRDDALKRAGRRTRLGLALDIVLTIVIALLAVQNNSTSARVSSADARVAAATAEANATRAASVSACQSTNVARAENAQLWRYVIGLLDMPRPGETAAQEAKGAEVIADLRARVAGTFAPRDCRKLVNGGSDGSR